jgi:hypothetical protein
MPLSDSWENSRPPALLARRRVMVTLIVSLLLGGLISLTFVIPKILVLLRACALGLLALLFYGAFERWPAKLPAWLARWVIQVIAVALAMPIGTFVMYIFLTPTGAPAFWHDTERLSGYASFSIVGALFAPWVALTALVRQKDALARHQALALQLARSEFERQALDARLSLLQAQVQPHFLFNTLANIQALVDASSPRASEVLRSLTAYLRAAVPRLKDSSNSLGRELDLARAYLEIMYMRMPDRLTYSIDADAAVRDVRCPPMTLLPLVENAVRHGIDPGEEGGSIAITATADAKTCVIRVADTGVGFGQSQPGLGTGLSTLRERLSLIYGDAAQLRVTAGEPYGVVCELQLPVA